MLIWSTRDDVRNVFWSFFINTFKEKLTCVPEASIRTHTPKTYKQTALGQFAVGQFAVGTVRRKKRKKNLT